MVIEVPGTPGKPGDSAPPEFTVTLPTEAAPAKTPPALTMVGEPMAPMTSSVPPLTVVVPV